MADQGTSKGGRDGDRPPYAYGRGPWGRRGTPYGGGTPASGFAWPPVPGTTGHRAPMAAPPQAAYAREELAYRATWPAPGDTPPPTYPRSLGPVSRQLSPAASSSTGLAAKEEPLVVSATMLALVCAAAVQTALALLSVATAAAAAVGSESEDGPSASALVVVPPHEAAAARGELINHSPSPSPVRALHSSSTVHPSCSNLAADIARKLFVGKSAAAAWHEGSAWAAAEEDESDIDLPEKSQNYVSDSLHCLFRIS